MEACPERAAAGKGRPLASRPRPPASGGLVQTALDLVHLRGAWNACVSALCPESAVDHALGQYEAGKTGITHAVAWLALCVAGGGGARG